jgi:hypothetical protein
MPVVATSHNATNVDASYSMLFSPAASSLASTPGGGIGGVGTMNQNPAGAAVGASMGLELELNWDPSMVKNELLQASAILSHRGLKLAAKWAAEQVMGIPVGRPAFLTTTTTEEDDPLRPSIMQEELSNMNEQDWYAKSLLDLGEFLHAAAVLSQDPSGYGNSSSSSSSSACDITQMGPPQEGLSSYGFFVRAYALFMAGERRKEEEYSALERYVTSYCISVCDLGCPKRIPRRQIAYFDREVARSW